MKNLLSLLAAVGLTFGVASAQVAVGGNNSVAGVKNGVDVTGFKAPANLGESPSESTKFPNTHPDLRPRLGGVFVDGAKYGTQLINPCAPASYGIGEKYLSAPDPRYDLEHECGPAAHRDAGGIKLFSLEF